MVLYGGGGALLGFDLDESPARCYLLPAGGDPPELVPRVWKEIDGWISTHMEDFLPFKN